MSPPFQIPVVFWHWALLPIGLLLYLGVVFLLLPQYAVGLSRRRPERARALLEGLLCLPAPGGEAVRALVRYHLLVLHFQQERYAASEDVSRALLANTLPFGLEADVRRRLADALDAQGKTADAETEMTRATSAALRGKDAAALTARGDLLKRKHRYMEAFAAYEAALCSPGVGTKSMRAEIMVRMGLAAFDAGRPDLTVDWMENAIAEGAQGLHLRNAHSMAGVAYGNQGRFSKAIPHTSQAVTLAEAQGQPTEAGRAMAMLVSHHFKRGDVPQALRLCEEIERRQWINRTYFFTKADCLEVIGRYEEGHAVLLGARGYRESSGARIAHYQRRQEALVNLALARNLILQGRPEAAWDELQVAVVAFQGDDKVTLMCDDTAMRLLAILGRREQAEARMASVEQRLEKFSEDRSKRLGSLYSLGRAQYALGDYALAASRWQAYLDAWPNPVWQPCGYFFLGDCLERLGDRDGARRAYQQATCVPIADAEENDAAWPPAPSRAVGHTTGRFVDTHEARLARQRLEEGR